MTVLIQLTTAGLDTGPFNLYSNLDSFGTPFEVGVTKVDLLAGYLSSLVPDGTTTIRVCSTGLYCANCIDITVETPIPCGTLVPYSGGQSYPTTETIGLGEDIGDVDLNYDAISVPDRFIVRWDGSVVIDTGYRGSSSYDFGGGLRSDFTSSLLGEIDPITLNTYPDFTTYPDDGYPRIVGPGSGTASFNKNLTTPTIATVEVYAPMTTTVWSFTLGCPTITTTTSTTTVP